jgi:hypothetical protein
VGWIGSVLSGAIVASLGIAIIHTDGGCIWFASCSGGDHHCLTDNASHADSLDALAKLSRAIRADLNHSQVDPAGALRA